MQEPSLSKLKAKLNKQHEKRYNKAQNQTKPKAEKIAPAETQSSNNNELQNQTIVNAKNQTNTANDVSAHSVSKANIEILVPK